jgi:hypothetical protein
MAYLLPVREYLMLAEITTPREAGFCVLYFPVDSI